MVDTEGIREAFWSRVDEKAGYEYPAAGGPEAQPEVRQAVERWRNEEMDDPDDTRHTTPLLYWLLGSGTPPYKMSKEDAAYQGSPNAGERCADCEYAYEEVATGAVICSQMRGRISLDGWCRLFDAAD